MPVLSQERDDRIRHVFRRALGGYWSMSVWQHIERVREERSITQEVMSEHVGVRQGTWSRWVNGGANVPLDKLLWITVVLGIELGDFEGVEIEQLYFEGYKRTLPFVRSLLEGGAFGDTCVDVGYFLVTVRHQPGFAEALESPGRAAADEIVGLICRDTRKSLSVGSLRARSAEELQQLQRDWTPAFRVCQDVIFQREELAK